jgi:hypothetical protein
MKTRKELWWLSCRGRADSNTIMQNWCTRGYSRFALLNYVGLYHETSQTIAARKYVFWEGELQIVIEVEGDSRC